MVACDFTQYATVMTKLETQACVNWSRIGGFFKRERLKSGLSIGSIVDTLELSDEVFLANYEAGLEPIPAETICVLSNLFNISPEKIIALMTESF